MSKEAKRKAFNFFRSYFDTYQELLTDRQKVEFIDALLAREFYGIKPDKTKMDPFSWLAYSSQAFSIDSQVEGYENKTGVKLPESTGSVKPEMQRETQPVQKPGKDQLLISVKVDYKRIVEAYHKNCHLMPKVVTITKNRETAIRSRIKEHGQKVVLNAFEKAGNSKFLTGRTDKVFCASFDWILKPSNFIKIIEGNYDDRKMSDDKPF